MTEIQSRGVLLKNCSSVYHRYVPQPRGFGSIGSGSGSRSCNHHFTDRLRPQAFKGVFRCSSQACFVVFVVLFLYLAPLVLFPCASSCVFGAYWESFVN